MDHKSMFWNLFVIYSLNTAWGRFAPNQPGVKQPPFNDYPDTPPRTPVLRWPPMGPGRTLPRVPVNPTYNNEIKGVNYNSDIKGDNSGLPPRIPQNIPPNGCLFGEKRCLMQCTARGFTRGVCNSYTCSCLKDAVKSSVAIRLCSTSCPQHCAIKSRNLNGMCDDNDFCYCYDEKGKVDLNSGKCYIPEDICKEKCINNGFEMFSCLDELCICADSRSKYKAYNYKGGDCMVPKKYCQTRCAGAKFPKGVCYKDRCICMMHGDTSKDFFVIDVGKDDADCDPCKKKCRKKAYSGRCIANECVCMNGEDFEVLGTHDEGQRCALPKDYCTFACANHKFYKEAKCSAYSCMCHDGKKEKVLDFEKGECKIPNEQCKEGCQTSAHQFLRGFCNGAHCLCMHPRVKNDLPPFTEGDFVCEKYPRAPFSSICISL